ncbi:MAG: translation initiation factor IF-2 [Acidobacteria bacterium]|nr:translation initiation factor IF-2 [Acidobacteriota bacterium]
MAKVRIYQLAKELGVEETRIMEILEAHGMKSGNRLIGLDEDQVRMIKEELGREKVSEPSPTDEKIEAITEEIESKLEKEEIKKKPRRTRRKKLKRVDNTLTAGKGVVEKKTVKEGKITLSEGVTVKELSEKLGIKSKVIMKKLLEMGILATINQTLDKDTAMKLCQEFGCEAEVVSFEEEVILEEEMKPKELMPRDPVVTVMGHVDHGKTSLLDAIRQTNVAEREMGGITQHIGAYKIEVNGRGIVFLDTPGHEAFTRMRSRGAKVTDIVVLVVAADDGVMPQTVEAINHAKAAGVPILVAVNKIDKPNADPEKVKKQLSDLGLTPEEWGGKTVFVEISAKKRINLDLLLEMLLLIADLEELKADPNVLARGTVLEARLDRARGPVATVLIQSGTLRVGEPFIVGAVWGRVRAMFDDRGRRIDEAGPSTPVEITGLQGLPEAGDIFQVVKSEAKARQISNFRQAKLREKELARKRASRLTLDKLYEQIREEGIKELPLIIKADVHGSLEVVEDAVEKLSSDKIRLRIIHSGVGAINVTDVLLASASNAIIIGFNVRPEKKAIELAEAEGVDIRLHTVIYNLTNEIKNAMVGMLEPTFEEVPLGRAEVREVFRIPRVGVVAGCYVTEGKLVRNAEVRLLRDNIVIHEGKIGSLRRFKEDVVEVREGFECGVGIANFNDIKIGDIIECFQVVKKAPEIE